MPVSPFFTEPMDLAIVLGDQYGDKTSYTNFTFAGHDFGQGIYYLATNTDQFTPLPAADGARLSQFADPPATATRPTTVWEAALPLACLGAGGKPPEQLFLAGVIVSDATAGNDRYLSRSVLADRAWSTPDEWGNTGTNTVVLRPIRIALPAAEYLGDGIANAFRVKHYGTPDAPAADEDTDGDGMTTLGEYVAGTDPTDPSSQLRVLADGTISPPPPEGRLSAVEYATDLCHPVWTSPAPEPATVAGPLFLRARVALP